MTTQTLSSNLYHRSPPFCNKYDVFLSFRGVDTRKSFIDNLYIALHQEGIKTFRDDEELERGETISLALVKAIEESRLAIVVLSKNYASSTWCLDELVKIIQCRNKLNMTVLPVFYDVEPSDVRKQTGIYKKAFARHQKVFKDKKVTIWRKALTEIANISGFVLQDRNESEAIQDIVKQISSNFNQGSSSESDLQLLELDHKSEHVMINHKPLPSARSHSPMQTHLLLNTNQTGQMLSLSYLDHPQLPSR